MEAAQIQQLLKSIQGSNVINRRLVALKTAGYDAIFVGQFRKWGKSGDVKEINGRLHCMVSCAKGRWDGINQISYFICDVYLLLDSIKTT